MSIAVQCPECNSRLNAPDAAAGKRVKCPKCATVMQIPALENEFEVVDDDDGFEVVDDVPTKPKAKPAPKRRMLDDDDDNEDERPAPKRRALMDDDDDEDDRPRRNRKVADDYEEEDDDDEDEDDRPRRKKAKKKSGGSSNLALIIGGAIAAVLLLGVGGYFLFSGSKGGTSSATGVKWTKFDAPDSSFTAYFPNGTPVAASMGDFGDTGQTPAEMEQAKQMMEAFGMKIDAWKKTDSGRDYAVMVMAFPAAMAKQFKPEELNKPIPKNGRGGLTEMPGMKGGEILNDESTTISGQTAKQILVKDKTGKYMFVRLFFAGTKLVMVMLRSDSELKADDAVAKEYFSKFEWKAK